MAPAIPASKEEERGRAERAKEGWVGSVLGAFLQVPSRDFCFAHFDHSCVTWLGLCSQTAHSLERQRDTQSRQSWGYVKMGLSRENPSSAEEGPEGSSRS